MRKDVAKGGGCVLLPVLYFPFVSPFAEDVYVFFCCCCRNWVVVMREFWLGVGMRCVVQGWVDGKLLS
jgi:hypothetical protein